jgi:TetR/AcrR family transcriptional repressor of lmrAB and yxaGH operons
LRPFGDEFVTERSRDKTRPDSHAIKREPTEDSDAQPRSDLFGRLFDLVSQPGVENLSLSEIGRITGESVQGLGRFFPAGANRVVSTLVGDVSTWLSDNVLAVLSSKLPPEERIRVLYASLEGYVQTSERSFMLTILALDTSNEKVRQTMAFSVTSWVTLLASALEANGLSRKEAQDRAEDSVIRVQGAAVYSRLTGNPEPLLRTLRTMPTELLRPSLQG